MKRNIMNICDYSEVSYRLQQIIDYNELSYVYVTPRDNQIRESI